MSMPSINTDFSSANKAFSCYSSGKPQTQKWVGLSLVVAGSAALAFYFLKKIDFKSYFGASSMQKKFAPQVEITKELVQKILCELGIEAKPNFTLPPKGRIASNAVIESKDGEKFLLRFYPEGCEVDKLETGTVEFEVEALSFLASQGILVPNPLQSKEAKKLLKLDGIKAFAYKLIPGNCLEQKDLSSEVATKAGTLLMSMMKASEGFKLTMDNPPRGDLSYILRISDIVKEKYPVLSDSESFKEMVDFVKELESKKQLEKTPLGIVHADFFFENIIISPKGDTGIIDFGDVYYGHVLQDVVIGAMEFCVQEDTSWNMEMFTNFIAPLKPWLSENNVSFQLFYDLLKANCLRFAVYTLPSDLEENNSVEENGYIKRFKDLQKPELREQLTKAYSAQA